MGLFSLFTGHREDREKNNSSTVKLNVSFSTDKGKIRTANEDNFYICSYGIRGQSSKSGKLTLNDAARYVFAVLDGMGGEAYGDLASEIAAKELKNHIQAFREADTEDFHKIANEYAVSANSLICKMIEEKKCSRSGSTLVMAVTVEDMAYIFTLGDSRVYHYFNGKLTQVSEDQTLAMKKVKANIYTLEEAKASPDAHKVTAFLGADMRMVGLKTLTYEPVKISGGGKLLLCSDGLTDMCTDEEIAEILSRNKPNAADLLVKKALENGGADNVTCVVVSC